MKKYAFRKIIRALKWPTKSMAIDQQLGQINETKNIIKKRLERLLSGGMYGELSRKQVGKRFDELALSDDALKKLEAKLTKYKNLGQADRQRLNNIGVSALIGGMGLTGGGLMLKDIMDQQSRKAEYVSPFEQLQLNEELPKLQKQLKERKQYGSWF